MEPIIVNDSLRKYQSFISISEIINMNIIPNSEIEKQREKNNVALFELNNKLRKNLFDVAKLSEKDSVFIFNYKENKTLAFALKDLKVIAIKNGYQDNSELQTGDDYHIGFAIGEATNYVDYPEHLSTNIVCINKENPFTKANITPVTWKLSNVNNVPSTLKKHIKKQNVYEFKNNNKMFYMLDDNYSTRSIFVFNERKELLYQNKFTLGDLDDFSEIKPANGLNSSFTGQLFDQNSDIIFGIINKSIGCESIYYLNSEKVQLTIKCDNRH